MPDHPLNGPAFFMSGGLGGVAHEQVAPMTSWQASGTTCLYHPHHIGKEIEDFNK